MEPHLLATEGEPLLCEFCERPAVVKVSELHDAFGHLHLFKRVVCMECGWVRAVK